MNIKSIFLIQLIFTNLNGIKLDDLIKKIEQNDSSMVILNLSLNAMSDEIFIKIVQALAPNNSVRQLIADYNNITDTGIKELAICLTKNLSIEKISLINSPVSSRGIKFLEDSLEYNYGITEINPYGNDSSYPKLQKILNRNKNILIVLSQDLNEIFKSQNLDRENLYLLENFLIDLYANNIDKNFEISYGKSKINAHKNILCKRSGLFKKLFKDTDKLCNKLNVTEHLTSLNVSMESYEIFIKFLYTEIIKIPDYIKIRDSDNTYYYNTLCNLEILGEFYQLNKNSTYFDQLNNLFNDF